MNDTYEVPAAVEVGDFTEITLGQPTGGFDASQRCWWVGC